jgi:MEMO1 family protein
MGGVIRKAAAAGRFYPRLKVDLQATIDECFRNSNFGPGQALEFDNMQKEKGKKRKVLGGVSPHAGYVYSGSGTALTVQEICKEGIPDSIIILGTQHTGYHQIGLMKEGAWETPFGRIKIDSELASIILEGSEIIKEDNSAFNGFPHGREHNIEVQIPFIQYAAAKGTKEIKIVPIKVGSMKEKDVQHLGEKLAQAIEKYQESKDVAIIASSDMTHYQPKNPNNPKQEIVKIQHMRDSAVIDAFKTMDWKLTHKKGQETTVCGPQTISTLMVAGQKLGYSSKALKYYTSFEKMGEETPCDYSVGYFSGVLIE